LILINRSEVEKEYGKIKLAPFGWSVYDGGNEKSVLL